MSERALRIGYLPLLDAGLLLVAAAKGFDREEGLRFDIRREPSWANLRDKMAFGLYDAAHMLAPAVLASALGLDGFPSPMVGVAALGLDGNAVNASTALAGRLGGGPAASARALAAVALERPLRFAHVFPYSAHHYQLLLWLRAGGVAAEALSLTVTPPPLARAALAAGYIDGFCVGAPWNTLAQDSGEARILFSCAALVRDCPEKVLAFPRAFVEAEPEIAQAAARALRRAAAWGEQAENFSEFHALVGRTLEEPLPEETVARLLSSQDGPPVLRLDAKATALSPDQAHFLLLLMALAGQARVDETVVARARAAFLPFGGEPDLPLAPDFYEGRFSPEQADAFLADLVPSRG
jgi:NitT/TauT family transport system ATP-binding protein